MRNKCYVIPVQRKCNMNCCFCSSKLRPYHDENEVMQINQDFYRSLTHIQKFGIRYFEFTGGGEPFLHLGLQEIIYAIRGRIPDAYIKVYTNGKTHTVIKAIDELDISVIHWDRNIVFDLCGYDDPIPLEEHLAFFRENYSCQIRLSVPIIRGAISNREEAIKLIEKTCGYAERYVFRPLNKKTLGYERLWASFDLDVENAEVDRDFSDEDEIILWFSNNQIYRDWYLRERLF